MLAIAPRLWHARYSRYAVASALSLGVDVSLFTFLVAAMLPAGLASACGYVAGIAVHWLVSSRLVFADSLRRGRARRRQQLLFIVSALAGLAITIGIVGIGTALGLPPLVAKLIAIVASFQATWLMRSRLVFA